MYGIKCPGIVAEANNNNNRNNKTNRKKPTPSITFSLTKSYFLNLPQCCNQH